MECKNFEIGDLVYCYGVPKVKGKVEKKELDDRLEPFYVVRTFQERRNDKGEPMHLNGALDYKEDTRDVPVERMTLVEDVKYAPGSVVWYCCGNGLCGLAEVIQDHDADSHGFPTYRIRLINGGRHLRACGSDLDFCNREQDSILNDDAKAIRTTEYSNPCGRGGVLKIAQGSVASFFADNNKKSSETVARGAVIIPSNEQCDGDRYDSVHWRDTTAMGGRELQYLRNRIPTLSKSDSKADEFIPLTDAHDRPIRCRAGDVVPLMVSNDLNTSIGKLSVPLLVQAVPPKFNSIVDNEGKLLEEVLAGFFSSYYKALDICKMRGITDVAVSLLGYSSSCGGEQESLRLLQGEIGIILQWLLQNQDSAKTNITVVFATGAEFDAFRAVCSMTFSQQSTQSARLPNSQPPTQPSHDQTLLPIEWERAFLEGQCSLKVYSCSGIEVYIEKGSATHYLTPQDCVGAIVNAANEECIGGSGIDAAINALGGPELETQRRMLPLTGAGVRCETGKCVMTTAGNMGASFVFHAVPPEFRNQEQTSTTHALLSNTYASVLNFSQDHQNFDMDPNKTVSELCFCLLAAGKFRGEETLRSIINSGLDGIHNCLLNVTREVKLKRITLCAFDEEEARDLLEACKQRFFPFGAVFASGERRLINTQTSAASSRIPTRGDSRVTGQTQFSSQWQSEYPSSTATQTFCMPTPPTFTSPPLQNPTGAAPSAAHSQQAQFQPSRPSSHDGANGMRMGVPISGQTSTFSQPRMSSLGGATQLTRTAAEMFWQRSSLADIQQHIFGCPFPAPELVLNTESSKMKKLLEEMKTFNFKQNPCHYQACYINDPNISIKFEEYSDHVYRQERRNSDHGTYVKRLFLQWVSHCDYHGLKKD